jgi:restriction system protein
VPATTTDRSLQGHAEAARYSPSHVGSPAPSLVVLHPGVPQRHSQIFAPSKNNAVARLEHLLKHGTDPGAVVPLPVQGLSPQATTTVPDDSGVDEPELATDYEQAATDQIMTRIQEDFAGHELTALVAAVLEAEGFRCLISPPGPDGGVDISAGRGPLGLDTPHA